MWRRTTLSVAGNQREAVLDAVLSYFESDRRYPLSPHARSVTF